jgi:aminopeptidase
MRDERIVKLADLLVNYSVAVKPGDRVAIQGSLLAESLMREVYMKVLQAGGHPFINPSFTWTKEEFYRYASDEQLQYVHEPLKQIISTYDVLINIMASANTRNLSKVDPAKMVLVDKANEDIMKIYMDRASKGELRWTLTLFPTEAHAMDAEMSLTEFENFVYSACMPDQDDPVSYWKKVSEKQQKIVEWLKGKKQVHVIGKETDLRMSVEDRVFINCDCKENVPDGEIFTGPVEDSVEGQVYFSYPTIFAGREVNGVRLWFEKGRIVKATAEKNEEFLLQTLDTDAGARYIGEFAIGTNEGITSFTREILFDEKIGGSFHMAMGAGYPETGSQNKSAIHWDMICDLRDGGEIWVDNELMYKNGKFVLDL